MRQPRLVFLRWRTRNRSNFGRQRIRSVDPLFHEEEAWPQFGGFFGRWSCSKVKEVLVNLEGLFVGRDES